MSIDRGELDVVADMLKKDTKSLYYNTRFILLEDEKNHLFFYDKDKGILISCDQEKAISSGANNVIQLGERQYMNRFFASSDAIVIFQRLKKIQLCSNWKIQNRVWDLGKRYFVHNVYDGKRECIRTYEWGEETFELKCLYLDPKTLFVIYEESLIDPNECKIGLKLKIAKNQNFEQNQEKRISEDKNVKVSTYRASQEKKLPEGKKTSVSNKTRQKEIAPYVTALLNCDKQRCRLESYEESMLYDIKRGHWDLFETDKMQEELETNHFIPRDPRKDIKNGVVGIDFGTKSTVVVKQEGTNQIRPIRIGTVGLSVEVKDSDFENPTIIECINLNAFLEKYRQKIGRPETSCEDFFVSYDALNDFNACVADEFYAYYMELKQWANQEKTDISVLDKQRNEYQFGEYSSDNDKIINPIELYAYYIGMYINNMRNGIYMKYLMSFPVGHSKETRQFIKESFERGIKKSLPSCVLEDADCMKKFDMQLGISEPAAYAVTALELSGLDPKDETERYMYGIFDFGGGTTDFDFGIWRGASESENEIEGYDYVLECFGADSDVTLGGENILEMLAYTVFENNKEMADKNRITCSLPIGETPFLGSERLISNSQIAKRNMNILKEELRPLWHQEEGWLEKYKYKIEESLNTNDKNYEEYIDILLYDVEGEEQSNCKFVVDTEKLIVQIKDRIRKGVEAFFRCMEKTFRFEEQVQEQEDKIYIFLAGNSSKSIFVKEIFEEMIQKYYAEFKELDKRSGNSYFQLTEPLAAQYDKDKEQWINAKTGVAYGLVKSREGSTIKVIKNAQTDAAEQTRFKYYLGRERRRHFACILSPVVTSYGSWVRFQGAVKSTVRIYYTTNPMADPKLEQLPIDDIAYKEIAIEPEEGAFIFIRSCKPSVIEYTIAFSEEDIREDGNINCIDFDIQGE